MKNDVKLATNLPTKNEQVLFCRLSKEQKNEYVNYINSKDCKYILDNKKNILKALIQLRKVKLFKKYVFLIYLSYSIFFDIRYAIMLILLQEIT